MGKNKKVNNKATSTRKDTTRSSIGTSKTIAGRVKWFNRKIKYGFIEAEDGKSYFVHANDIKEGRVVKVSYETVSLKSGDRVEFNLMDADKGPQCVNVVDLTEKEKENDQ